MTDKVSVKVEINFNDIYSMSEYDTGINSLCVLLEQLDNVGIIVK